jgi:L-ascorbate metabolism protein UlaG (beta-lactamase superfamily)
MKINKIGHCCLLIEEQGLRILTDPGIFTVGQHELLEKIDVILITHEHSDHFHVESLKQVIEKNPIVRIVTNSAVGKLLDEAHIKYEIVEHGQNVIINNVEIEGLGNQHAEIYDAVVARVQNTGYMVNSRFFYPGDDLYNPQRVVEILALPVAGPWLKMKEAIDYAKTINPKKCFPVHDGMLKAPGVFHTHPQKALALSGIEMILPEAYKPMEF